MPSASPQSIRAAALGGRVTCISALKAQGVWCIEDYKLHLSVASNASALPRGPARRQLIVHYTKRPGASHGGVYDDIVHALAQTFGCQSRENVIVAVNSALNQSLIGNDDLADLRGMAAAKYWTYFTAVDARCESGLEMKCALRLRSLNIRFSTQVYIRGVGRVDILVGDRLVIELDGIGFHSGDAVKRDRRRDLALHGLGYIVLRVDYGQVMEEWDKVEEVIRAYVSRNEHRWSARHVRAGLAPRSSVV
jgi:very-short-patch-repair endonuclease